MQARLPGHTWGLVACHHPQWEVTVSPTLSRSTRVREGTTFAPVGTQSAERLG